MKYYIFTIYVTECKPGVDCHGQRTTFASALNLKSAYLKLREDCRNLGFLKWHLVYIFSENAN